MIIKETKIPVYGICILISLILGSIYIFFYLKKRKIKTEYILYLITLVLSFAIFGGVLLSKLMNSDGLSSYAGAISVILAGFIFEKIDPNKNHDYLKASIISLPLIYGFAKIGCFLAGCCFGIPYDGIFSVIYIDKTTTPLFPVQLLETLLFVIAFIVINIIHKRHEKYIIEITIIISALLKFLTDYLRASHLTEIISTNQIISIIFIAIAIILIIKKSLKK